MCAADAVLAKSGTCTLEAALARRPMVVVYRQSPLAYWLARGRRRFYLPYFSLPNILCKDFIVPELIQNAASPAAIANAVSRQLNDADNRARLQARFAELHSALRQNAAEKAADAVARLAEDKKTAETNKK
jgi:lipid-A-disaccharide synthase